MTSDVVFSRLLRMTLPLWKKQLPLQLTLSRVYALPFVVLLLQSPGFGSRFFAALLFALASLTDYFDGYYARKWNLVSNFGKFLDPVTDKILVTGVLIFLVFLQKVDPYSVILLLVRDTFVGGIRSAAAADQVVIDAKQSGKWKTGLQMGAIPVLILHPFPEPLIFFDKIGFGLLWISVILSITSGVEYYRAYLRSRRST